MLYLYSGTGKQTALKVSPSYCIIHAVVKRLVLGEDSTRSIWGVGELGAVDEVIHRGTSSTTRGVPVREVKVPLAVVTVALKDNRTNRFCQDANCILALLTCLMNPYCCKKFSFQSGCTTGYTHFTFFLLLSEQRAYTSLKQVQQKTLLGAVSLFNALETHQ